MSFSVSGKPIFEKVGQVFVELREGTANAYVLCVAQAEFGDNHTLSTNDGLELHDSAVTQGKINIYYAN